MAHLTKDEQAFIAFLWTRKADYLDFRQQKVYKTRYGYKKAVDKLAGLRIVKIKVEDGCVKRFATITANAETLGGWLDWILKN
jgi:hypothetical protein